MANEAVLMVETELPMMMTVANGTGIAKGTVCKLADPLTASAASANEDIIAGISAEEKIASDGKTKTSVYRRGVFKVTASGAVPVGDACGVAGRDGNLIYSITGTQEMAASGSRIIGYALETAADAETFLMELNIQAGITVV